MDIKELKKYKEVLLVAKQEILEEFEQMQKESNEIHLNEVGDEMDLAVEYQNRQLFGLMSSREKNKLDQINSALKKISDGEYGFCEECFSEISENRLQALPFATLCIECKEKNEQITPKIPAGNDYFRKEGII